MNLGRPPAALWTIEVGWQVGSLGWPAGDSWGDETAGKPASIFVRSKANGCGPRKAVPLELKTLTLI